MKTKILALVTTLVTAASLSAQDQQWLRMWENAQKLKPARVTSSERIGPMSQAGIPFVVHGVVLDPSGKPLGDVEVFAYQTDTHGIYAPPGAADPWPLKGWALTDSQGRFEFRTIRPAAYPSNTIPGHVHLTFKTTAYGRQVTEVMFDDDPLATSDYRQRQGPGVMFGKVTKRGDGAQETSYRFTLKSRSDF
jgi:protocatechuate 3,4-dioxygenase beta subunit